MFGGAKGGGAVSALRALRLLRVLRLLTQVRSLQILMNVIQDTMGDLLNITILLGLFLVQVCILGLQFFAGKYAEEVKAALPACFDSIYWGQCSHAS